MKDRPTNQMIIQKAVRSCKAPQWLSEEYTSNKSIDFTFKIFKVKNQCLKSFYIFSNVPDKHFNNKTSTLIREKIQITYIHNKDNKEWYGTGRDVRASKLRVMIKIKDASTSYNNMVLLFEMKY